MNVKEDALAQLSEGWCPVCNTQFSSRGNKGQLLCESMVSYERVRAEVLELPDTLTEWPWPQSRPISHE